MSTAKVVTILHPSSAVNNIVNDASGNVAVGGTLTASTITSAAATALTIKSAGTTAMTIDTSQNVGIGTTSPGYALDVQKSATDAQLNIQTTGNNYSSRVRLVGKNGATDNEWNIIAAGTFLAGSQLRFTQGNWTSTPAMLLDSSGNLLVGTTTSSGKITTQCGNTLSAIVTGNTSGTAGYNGALFYNNGLSSLVGQIVISGTTASYLSVSDHRLKENVTPMTNGLATISALKPVTYDWISDKSVGEGFIAHELAEVIPFAVYGEKDAVNEDGSIKPQGVDYSKIVVHLVAAIQELTARLAALEAK